MRFKITYLTGIILLFALSCGTQRKNPVAKFYHNTTSYFNWYYNGELVWREAVRDINSKFKVPPEGLITLQYFGDENSAKGAFPQFDESIKKCEVVIFKHPNGNWIDNCRFLIGRNWFYKKNFYLAAQNFEFVIKEYPKTKILPDVYLWLARTYYMIDRSEEAEKIIVNKLKHAKLKKRQRGELAMMQADSYVKQKEYDKAIKALEKNLKFIKGRLNKARTYFLLGQLYAQDKKLAKSYDAFHKVTKINTDYELIFNAKLQSVRLLVEQQEGADESQKIYRALKTMIRDEKNVDFRDQLYYEMAKLDLKKDAYTEAVAHLDQSIRTSTSNPRQKALSYYLSGKINFYNLLNLDKAQAYFDSASQVISKNDPEYKEITTIGATLNEYVGYKRTIHYQDSMLVLASLSKSELDKRVDAVIEAEKARKAQEEAQMMQQMNMMPNPNQQDPFAPKSGGGFYFDFPDQVSAGRMEFQRVWGTRKNEDNWRRKNKELVLTNTDEAEDTAAAVDSAMVKEYGKKYKYYKDIPRSEEEKEWANNKIMEAMFGLGQIFDKKLNMPDSAIVAYQNLIKRYPDSEYALKSRFALYHIYTKVDPYQADEYKDYICNKHPESVYCKLLKNEDISEQLYADKQELKDAYLALWATYMSGDYETVISFSAFLAEKFTEGEEAAQIQYLRGLSYAELGNTDSLRSIFIRIRDQFPKAGVTPTVRRTLELMDKKGGAQQPGGNIPPRDEARNEPGGNNNGQVDLNSPAFQGFTKDPKPNERFFVVMLVNKEVITNNDFKIKFSDFNDKYFQNEKLTVSIFFYMNKQLLSYISQFRTAAESQNYMTMLRGDESFKTLAESPDNHLVFITPTNFKVAYGNQRFADYFQFYEQVILPSLK